MLLPDAIGPKASWLLPVKFSGFSEIKFVLSFPLALEIYVTFFSLILLNKFQRFVGLRICFVPSFPSPFLCIVNHKEILLTPLIMREVLGLDTELEWTDRWIGSIECCLWNKNEIDIRHIWKIIRQL